MIDERVRFINEFIDEEDEWEDAQQDPVGYSEGLAGLLIADYGWDENGLVEFIQTIISSKE